MTSHSYQQRLQDLSSFIYGTTRLGDETLDREQRIAVAHEAMAADVWFHVSDQYGTALDVLAEAFSRKPENIPLMIFKLEAARIDEVRDVIQRNIQPLGVEAMDIGQLCLRDRAAADFCNGSRGYDEFRKIRDEGLVKRYVMEVFPWTSPVALKALHKGCADDLIEGFIFYFNPLQRFASNELWDAINEMQIPIVGMRTVCGAHVRDLRDVPGVAWKDYLRQRAVQVAPIFEQSGVSSWAEFCTRFAYSFPLLRATVGSTATPARLQELVTAAQHPQPLRPETVKAITDLQRQWASEVDSKAEPWSM